LINEFYNRIGFEGDLSEISIKICDEYNIGLFLSNKLIEVGAEDFSYALTTSTDRYLVKIFERHKNITFCDNYIKIILRAIKHGIHTPMIYEHKGGYIYDLKIKNKHFHVSLFKFVDGKDLYSLHEEPTEEQVKVITKQLCSINKIKCNEPQLFYDWYFAINFCNEFEKKSKWTKNEDYNLILPIYEEFKKVDIEKLPKCYSHSDLIKTNIMKDNSNNIWIIDWSGSGFIPRIADIGNVISSICFCPDNDSKSKLLEKVFLEEYTKEIPLTKEEIDLLHLYAKVIHAMGILAANYEMYAENIENEENRFWLSYDRKGLEYRNKIV